MSLFERLILNGFPFVALEEQHRMGPPIASVVSRVFYPQLRNHPAVERYPDIRYPRNLGHNFLHSTD